MGLIRLLIIAALIYLVWRVVKGLLGERRRRDDQAGGPATLSQKMVKCRQCGVHVPENEAFQHNNMVFCSQDHQRQYLEHHEP
jgi:uncharacterized protein